MAEARPCADAVADTECAVSDVKENITVTGKFTLDSYTVTGAASTGGTMNCTPATATYFDTITCTPTADAGYAFDKAADIDPAGMATVACTATECMLSEVRESIKVLGVFKVRPAGKATAVPTVSDIGLLLSSIALAGAAAPALRRRARKGRKQN